MRIYITFILLSFLNTSVAQFKNSNDSSGNLVEGELTYNVTGPGLNSESVFELQFDTGNVRINAKYAYGFSKTYICDKSTNEILALNKLYPSSKNAYFHYCTASELIMQAFQTSYADTVKILTKEYKTILGYKCQKILLRLGTQATLVLWTTDKIKVGIRLPDTPLALEDVALEFEFKISGKVDRRYSIKSISTFPVDKNKFKQIVPEEYFLILPYGFYSIDSEWSSTYKESNYLSLSYPFFGSGRDTTIEYLKKGISNIVKLGVAKIGEINFMVNENGKISDIEVRLGSRGSDLQIEKIKDFLKNMSNWTPAKVKGIPAKSLVSIFM